MKQHGLFDEPQESPPHATVPLGPPVLAQDARNTTEASISTQDRIAPPVASPERSAYLDLEQFVAGW